MLKQRDQIISDCVQMIADIVRARANLLALKDAAPEIERRFGWTFPLVRVGEGGRILELDQRVIDGLSAEGILYSKRDQTFYIPPDDPGPEHYPSLPMRPLKRMD